MQFLRTPLLALFLCAVTVTSVAADTTRDREARKLYVEVSKVLRNAECSEFRFAFVDGGLLAGVAKAFLGGGNARFEGCFGAYRPAAKIVDRILDNYADTEVAVLVAREGWLGTREFQRIESRLEENDSIAALDWQSSIPPSLAGSSSSAIPTRRSKPQPEGSSGETQTPSADFEQVLNSLARIQRDVARGDSGNALPQSEAGPLTATELDSIRAQVQRCWVTPISVEGVEGMHVDIRVEMNRDGSVRDATVLNDSRMRVDPSYRTVAESARRAVLKCSPLKAPGYKYDEWRVLTLRLDPRDQSER